MAEAARLTYMIPTLGRTTLTRVVDQIREQMLPTDELIVIADGAIDAARAMMEERLADNVRYFEHGPTNNWGSEQLDFGTEHATGDFLCYIGDDDEMLPGAMEAVRAGVEGKVQPHCFAMYHSGRVLANTLAACNVSGQQIVVPNVPGRIPRWAEDRSQLSDYVFIQKVANEWSDVGVRMHDDLICRLHAQNFGRVF
jgi:glycosyltransferase involved in cell wall biosynthesis